MEFAVVDVETTGVTNSARVIEIGVVVLDSRMRAIDEYETLIDPQRDLGPTHVHGITPSMLSMAPTFEDIATSLRRRLDGRVLVSHNAPFDSRMLANEFEHLAVTFDAGAPICTLRLTGDRLSAACRRLGVKPPRQHRALSDAKAAAGILRAIESQAAAAPMQITPTFGPLCLRTHRRCASADHNKLGRILSRISYRGQERNVLEYLELLDWVLDDAVITEDERKHLAFVAEEKGLTEKEIDTAHHRYFQDMVAASMRDGIITESERSILQQAADALSLSSDLVPSVTDRNNEGVDLAPGSSICFTGSFVDRSGQRLEREQVERLAVNAGFQVVPRVTKSKCDALVAVDPESASGKTKQARKFGKPIISATRFLERLSA